MKFLLVILTLNIGTLFSLYAQENCSDVLSVRARLIGKSIPDTTGGKCEEYYYSKIILQNNEDSIVQFYLFDCSWEFSWVIDNPSLYFWSPGCDGNWFELIKLGPRKSITFYGVLKSKCDLKENNFGLGFVMLPLQKGKLIDPIMIRDDYKKSRKVFWSDQLSLADKTNTFNIDLFFPNQWSYD